MEDNGDSASDQEFAGGRRQYRRWKKSYANNLQQEGNQQDERSVVQGFERQTQNQPAIPVDGQADQAENTRRLEQSTERSTRGDENDNEGKYANEKRRIIIDQEKITKKRKSVVKSANSQHGTSQGNSDTPGKQHEYKLNKFVRLHMEKIWPHTQTRLLSGEENQIGNTQPQSTIKRLGRPVPGSLKNSLDSFIDKLLAKIKVKDHHGNTDFELPKIELEPGSILTKQDTDHIIKKVYEFIKKFGEDEPIEVSEITLKKEKDLRRNHWNKCALDILGKFFDKREDQTTTSEDGGTADQKKKRNTKNRATYEEIKRFLHNTLTNPDQVFQKPQPESDQENETNQEKYQREKYLLSHLQQYLAKHREVLSIRRYLDENPVLQTDFFEGSTFKNEQEKKKPYQIKENLEDILTGFLRGEANEIGHAPTQTTTRVYGRADEKADNKKPTGKRKPVLKILFKHQTKPKVTQGKNKCQDNPPARTAHKPTLKNDDKKQKKINEKYEETKRRKRERYASLSKIVKDAKNKKRRDRRANLSPQSKKSLLARESAYNIKRYHEMSPEKKRQYLQKKKEYKERMSNEQYMRKLQRDMQRYRAMTPEQVEIYKQKRKEYRLSMTPEQRAAYAQQISDRLKNLNPKQRQEYLDRRKEYNERSKKICSVCGAKRRDLAFHIGQHKKFNERLKQLTPEQRKEIEEMTRPSTDRKMNPLWIRLRLAMITGSRIGKILTSRKSDKDLVRDTINNFLRPSGRKRLNADVDWGIKKEIDALRLYCDKKGLVFGQNVFQPGFIIDPEYPFIGATPDALVRDDGVVEIKCGKYSLEDHVLCYKGHKYILRARNNEPGSVIAGGVSDSDLRYQFNRNHPYYKQCVLELRVTGRLYLDFVYYFEDKENSSRYEMFVVRITKEEADKYWEEKMKDKVLHVYQNLYAKIPEAGPSGVKPANNVSQSKPQDTIRTDSEVMPPPHKDAGIPRYRKKRNPAVVPGAAFKGQEFANLLSSSVPVARTQTPSPNNNILPVHLPITPSSASSPVSSSHVPLAVSASFPVATTPNQHATSVSTLPACVTTDLDEIPTDELSDIDKDSSREIDEEDCDFDSEAEEDVSQEERLERDLEKLDVELEINSLQVYGSDTESEVDEEHHGSDVQGKIRQNDQPHDDQGRGSGRPENGNSTAGKNNEASGLTNTNEKDNRQGTNISDQISNVKKCYDGIINVPGNHAVLAVDHKSALKSTQHQYDFVVAKINNVTIADTIENHTTSQTKSSIDNIDDITGILQEVSLAEDDKTGNDASEVCGNTFDTFLTCTKPSTSKTWAMAKVENLNLNPHKRF